MKEGKSYLPPSIYYCHIKYGLGGVVAGDHYLSISAITHYDLYTIKDKPHLPPVVMRGSIIFQSYIVNSRKNLLPQYDTYYVETHIETWGI